MGSIVTLPSGAQVEFRALKGKEGKLLSDKDAVKSGLFLDKILSACTERVISAHPYGEAMAERFDWGKALVGDRFYALLQIRVLSLGAEFVFKIQCSQPECRKRWEHMIDLTTDLPVQRFSPEDQALFAAGNCFETADINKRKITYRLPIGHDEVMAARTQSIDGAVMQALLQRVISVDGEQIPRKYFEDLPWSEVFRLIDMFDVHNCGVKTDIEVECPECGSVEDIKLPFGRGFLVPTSRSVKSPA